MSYLEVASVIVVSLILSVVVISPSDVLVLDRMGSFLFLLFAPGIWLAMQFAGGPHSGSEVNVVVGMLIQSFAMYWAIRKILRQSKKSM